MYPNSGAKEIRCLFVNSQEWVMNHCRNNGEILITKHGKLLKPNIVFLFADLDLTEIYVVALRFLPNRSMSQNCAARLDPTTSLNLLKSEILTSGTTYIHPLGPFAGKELVENLLVFDDIKLSLSADSDPRYMILQQNIEYNINVEITPLRSLSDQDSYLLDSKVFSFPELQFTAVRRYRKQ